MYTTILDIENSVTRSEDKRIDGSPYNTNNYLVSVGYTQLEDTTVINTGYLFFKHDAFTGDAEASRAALQAVLSTTTLLVGHNLKHDLSWLLECGFAYDGSLYDTMIAEYLLQRGVKAPLSLDALAQLYAGDNADMLKRKDLVKDYWDQGIGYESMPIDIVEEYGRADVSATVNVYLKQVQTYENPDNQGLIKVRDMSFEFCRALTDMERNGIFIDMAALDAVEAQYLAEQQALQQRLAEIVAEVMGDTPINLGSPEQLSQVIYSRKVQDKEVWKQRFNLGTDARGKPLRRPKLTDKEFSAYVRLYTEKLKRTKAQRCDTCKGTGQVFRTKKDGEPYARPNKCPKCEGSGVLYLAQTAYAGFKLNPRGVDDVANGGFATDKDTLALLASDAQSKGNDLAHEFLSKMIRLNAVDVYLSSFVGGIKRNVQPDSILHPKFNQCVTATGRLSSSDPNMQNQPRNKTFPVRKCVSTRFDGGVIVEADYAQLEFRGAGQLSGDPQIVEDVANGVDVHSFTAQVLTEAGQATDRQGAKQHSFKPLYGGQSGTDAEVTYYKAFLKKYARVAQWHKELQDAAIRLKKIVLPTGREFAFPQAKRLNDGTSSFRTQICNYPVQSFCTADIVPMAVIRLWSFLRERGLKSLLVNTVHDSIVVDCFPGELDQVVLAMQDAMLGVVDELKDRYAIDMIVPIAIEIKAGPNWLDTKVVA